MRRRKGIPHHLWRPRLWDFLDGRWRRCEFCEAMVKSVEVKTVVTAPGLPERPGYPMRAFRYTDDQGTRLLWQMPGCITKRGEGSPTR